MSKGATVKFHCIPKVTPLFLDYLYDYPKVQPYFPASYSLEHFRKENIPSGFLNRQHRLELCEVLRAQNTAFGAGARTFENIERLRHTDCYVVVTGQQVGLFTGPAYTLYKALTAVKLAAHYACRGVQVVPLFWMATEDHDLAEIGHCGLADGDSGLTSFRYETTPQDQNVPAGKVTFSSSIDRIRSDFLALLPNSEFRREIAGKLEEAYRPGRTFGTAFGETLSFLFSNYGLILLDPLDSRLKEIWRPFFQLLLQRVERYFPLVDTRSQQLVTSGYHAQVTVEPDSTPLFLEEGGQRRALVRHHNQFRIKGSDVPLSQDDIDTMVTESPENVSPNVLLRPVAQDYLLPTLAYVAGPSEIAYLAQVSPLYENLGMEMPIIFPRSSISIIERKITKVLEKYRLDFCDVFRGPEAVIRLIVERSLDQSMAQQFEQLSNEFNRRLLQLEAPLRNVDATLVDALKTAQKKIQYHVEHLRTKFIHAEAKQQEVVTRQIERTLAFLHPLKSLQEREVNGFYFLSRYGVDLLAQLYEEIDLTDPDHRLVYV